MTHARVAVGLLVVGGVAAYVMLTMAQSRAAANLCEKNPAGTRIADPESLDGTWLLDLRGPIGDPERPGTEKLIFCAGMTMCDVS